MDAHRTWAWVSEPIVEEAAWISFNSWGLKAVDAWGTHVCRACSAKTLPSVPAHMHWANGAVLRRERERVSPDSATVDVARHCW